MMRENIFQIEKASIPTIGRIDMEWPILYFNDVLQVALDLY